MARLPQVGGDSGNWGSILNEYLAQAHDNDGKLKSAAVSAILAQGNGIELTHNVGPGTITITSTATGADGRDIELQNNGTHIQWRYVGSGSWTNLVALASITGAQGAAGEPGAQGEQGPKGDQGDQGPKGDQGNPGADGAQGPKGDQGDPGADGAQGPKGDQGDPGTPGTPGTAGEPGEQGEQGPKGDQGDQGEPGAQGEQGPKGDQGDPGADGEQGPKGDQGDPGVQGEPGEPKTVIPEAEAQGGVATTARAVSGASLARDINYRISQKFVVLEPTDPAGTDPNVIYFRKVA